jgi:hypothetical protein
VNDSWLSYERKRNAFEKRWRGRIEQALNKQLKEYVESYKAGRGDLNVFTSFELAETLLALYGDVGRHFARETNKQLEREARPRYRRGQGGQKSVHEPYQVKAGALGFSTDWAKKVADNLRLHGLKMAQSMSDTTRDKIIEILAKAQEEGLSLDETIKLIVAEVPEYNARRAETIVRTEVGKAAGKAKKLGAMALGVKLRKKWIAAKDHRTRINPDKSPKKGDHWVLNEMVVPFDKKFSNGVHEIDHPGDPAADKSEVINCRCTCTYEVEKDEQGNAVRHTYFEIVTA